MFVKRTVISVARRAAVTPVVARSISTSFAYREAAKNANTPSSQAAALANDSNKTVANYKTLGEIKTAEDLIGPGGQPGAVPTDLEQATGLERLEILGKMEGVDIFDMRPLDSSRIGTMADPIIIPSSGKERLAGCSGSPSGSHVTRWLVVSKDRPIERCDECGSVYKMDYTGPEEDDSHHEPPEFEEPKTFADYVRPEYYYL